MAGVRVPKRQKNFFFLHVSNVLGTYNLSVGYRTTKCVIQPLSASKQGANVKVPFGPVSECRIVERKESIEDEPKQEFKFVNFKNQTKLMKNVPFNNVEFSLSDFSRMVTQMCLENKKTLLAVYLSAINKSDGFIHHKEDVNDSDGFVLTGAGGATMEDVLKLGGTLQEYREFVRLAKESALMVDSTEKALEEINSNSRINCQGKRASSSAPEKPPKLSKSELVKKNEQDEVEDKDGIEEEYKKSILGVAHIPLDNISVSKDMDFITNPFRVQFIISSMRNRYDPALSVLVVCPVEQGADGSFSSQEVEKRKYYVVQKVSCFKAFQELDKTGEFGQLPGHKNRKALCYVLNNNKPELMLYGNARENFITGQFAKKTHPQDLLHFFDSLSKKDTTVKALKVVQRMAKLCCIGTEECSAMEKLCKWSRTGFDALMQVIHRYELFQTLDVKKTGHQQRLERGERLTIPNVVLKMLGRCSEDFFLKHYNAVLDFKISLKDLTENFKEVMEIGKVYIVLKTISGEDLKTLNEKYPGKFDYEKMREFIGAVITSKQKNLKAVQLQKYLEQVEFSGSSDTESPVKFVMLETTANVLNIDITKLDMIVYIMKEKQAEIVTAIVSAILGGGEKSFHGSLLVFDSETDYFEVLAFIRSQQAVVSFVKDFKVFPLAFKIDIKGNEEMLVNMKFALLFGKLHVLRDPLVTLYSDISEISKVVESVCPPRSEVGLICDETISPVKIHNDQLDKNVTYYGFENDLKRFQKKLNSDKALVTESVQPMVEITDAGSVPSTSTTPVKCPPSSFNDSGVWESQISAIELQL